MRFGSFVFSISTDPEQDHQVIENTLREIDLAEEIGRGHCANLGRIRELGFLAQYRELRSAFALWVGLHVHEPRPRRNAAAGVPFYMVLPELCGGRL